MISVEQPWDGKGIRPGGVSLHVDISNQQFEISSIKKKSLWLEHADLVRSLRQIGGYGPIDRHGGRDFTVDLHHVRNVPKQYNEEKT